MNFCKHGTDLTEHFCRLCEEEGDELAQDVVEGLPPMRLKQHAGRIYTPVEEQAQGFLEGRNALEARLEEATEWLNIIYREHRDHGRMFEASWLHFKTWYEREVLPRK